MPISTVPFLLRNVYSTQYSVLFKFGQFLTQENHTKKLQFQAKNTTTRKAKRENRTRRKAKRKKCSM